MRKLLALLALLAAPAAAQERPRLTTPADWRVRSDRAARVVDEGERITDAQVYYVTMSPGWHITTGPGAILFHPVSRAEGTYRAEAETFLFPQSVVTSGIGMFLGGYGFNEADPSYVAFLVRGDGQYSIQHRDQGTWRALVPWTAHEAVARRHADGTARNVLTVDVRGSEATFAVNGARVHGPARVPSAAGQLGLRIGDSVNLHVTRLSIVVP
jgi:hypothetical protein